MPIFEYRCESCGTSFEKLVRNGVKVECPSCGTAEVQQQLSTFAAHAKNGGGAPAPMPGGCPAGMCRTPGLCGRN
jgi:putative FmdB family regulatory protein